MTDKKSIRVWVDGCFDICHFGHANALRQAKELGDYLVVGIHTDEEITINKGPPVFTEEERYRIVRSMKWVDETVEGAPYVTELGIMDDYNCDFCAHGDDITTGADGVDTYHKVKNAQRFKEFKRTPGVSTTDLVSRLLKITDENPDSDISDPSIMSSYTQGIGFFPSTLLISRFQESLREPSPGEKVVYAPGSYDLFHVGHCMFLEKCHELGTYVIVGLYSDEDVKKMKGQNFPIVTFYERLLSVLSCKFVSNIILAPNPVISENMIRGMNIDYVAHGITSNTDQNVMFQVSHNLNIYREIDCNCSLTTEALIYRIISNRDKYEERNRHKVLKELVYNDVSTAKTDSVMDSEICDET